MGEIDRVLERVRQNRAARVQALRTAPRAVGTETTGGRGTLSAGARVFDTVSGQEGIVVARTTENIVVPAAGR